MVLLYFTFYPLAYIIILSLLEIFYLALLEFHLLFSAFDLELLIGPIVLLEGYLGRALYRSSFLPLLELYLLLNII